MLHLLCAILLNFAQTTTTRPAAAASTQPAVPTLGRYYGLLKNEFMRDTDGNACIVTPSAKAAIEQARQKIGDEKANVDAEVKSAQTDLDRAKAKVAEEERQAAANNAEAKKHDNLSVNRKQIVRPNGRRGKAVYTPNNKEAEKASQARKKANEHGANATAASKEKETLSRKLSDLKNQSNNLSRLLSPQNHMLPPQKYWADLSNDQKEELARVGISLNEFKSMLIRTGESENNFIERAYQIEKETRSSEAVIQRLRADFAKKLNDRASAPK